MIERQSKHMAHLLNDLLDVARITQGKIHIRKDVVDLQTPLREALQMVQSIMESEHHSLKVELPDQPVYIEGDAARLLQVQENLLANAAKYTPPGGQIQLSLREEHGEAVLRVHDNGVGIEPDLQDRIFELFVQGPRALERYDGSMGIGLTMVRTIVELHGGRISVCSEGPGKGSEFEVRLPITTKRPQAPHPTDDARDTSLKVLVVEDNTDSRELLESLLKLEGYEVLAAPDGIQGYEAIVSQQPDVALVDIGLPGMDGYEVARKVRAKLHDRPIQLVALTGYGRAIDREKVFAAGFNEHLVKPVDPTDLARVLRKPR